MFNFYFSIRGRLCGISAFFRNIGLLIGYILGSYVDYRYIPWIYITFPVIFFLIFVLIPNTPQYYIQKEQYQVSEFSDITNSFLILHLSSNDLGSQAGIDILQRIQRHTKWM